MRGLSQAGGYVEIRHNSMSGSCFFLSYARSDESDGLIRKFFEDLSKEVGTNDSFGNEPGFIDQSIKPGNLWAEKISVAAHNSRCLVALCSPTYFRSRFCGREVQLFCRPQKAYEIRPGKSYLSAERTVLFVIWKTTSLPRSVEHIQYYNPDGVHVYRDHGLEYIMRDPSQGQNYRALVEDLAKRIVTAVKEAPLRDSSDYRYIKQLVKIPPAFPWWTQRWALLIPFLMLISALAVASGIPRQLVPAQKPKPVIIYPLPQVTRRLGGSDPATRVTVTLDDGESDFSENYKGSPIVLGCPYQCQEASALIESAANSLGDDTDLKPIWTDNSVYLMKSLKPGAKTATIEWEQDGLKHLSTCDLRNAQNCVIGFGK
jgi:hypothetical protein